MLQNAYQKIEITDVKKISLRWTHDTSSSVNGNGLTAYERSVCGCQEGDHFGNLVNPAHSAQRVTFLAARQIALSHVASIFLCSNFQDYVKAASEGENVMAFILIRILSYFLKKKVAGSLEFLPVKGIQSTD